LSVWLFAALLLAVLAFFTEGLAFFGKINLATLDQGCPLGIFETRF